MGKSGAWLIATAVLATAGAAQAQEGAPAAHSDARAGTAWYERFTTSSGVTESIPGGSESERLPAPSWTLNQHWGVTVDIREANRVDRRLDGVGQDQTAVGAYYQFTPRVRLGGELSVGQTERTPIAPVTRDEEERPSAGVRIESAFRF